MNADTKELLFSDQLHSLIQAAVPLFWFVVAFLLIILFFGDLKMLVSRIAKSPKGSFGIVSWEEREMVTKTDDVRKEKGVEIEGNPDQLQLLFKAKGEDWEKSTKAMQLPNGCLVHHPKNNRDI